MGVNLNVTFKYLELNGGLMDMATVMWGDGVTVARYLYIPATVVYIDG